jgi:hypothetical protein
VRRVEYVKGGNLSKHRSFNVVREKHERGVNIMEEKVFFEVKTLC